MGKDFKENNAQNISYRFHLFNYNLATKKAFSELPLGLTSINAEGTCCLTVCKCNIINAYIMIKFLRSMKPFNS